ncbi:MAG TPA: hypothetical protein VG389_16070 [Myxococcota bacterium]|jgi:hypothetical protein|nr:hypothetical protein [Myxococcota bacterium]
MARAGYEYKSRVTVWGLPLVHVAYGIDPVTGRRRVARGVLAVGQAAFGVVAVGQLAVGVVAVGQLGVGVLLGVGQLAAGLVALGQFAAAVRAAVGQFAAGMAVTGQTGLCGARGELAYADCFVGGPLHAGASHAPALALLPVILAWATSAVLLAALAAAAGRRERLARALPSGPPFTLDQILPADQSRVLKVTGAIAPDAGVVFLVRAPGAAADAPLVRRDFLVGDGAAGVRVRTDGAEFFVRAAGDEASLRAGDVVTVCGVVEREADPAAAPDGYRMAPSRWTLGGDLVVVDGPTDAPVRAAARLLPALAGLLVAAAVAAAVLALLIS